MFAPETALVDSLPLSSEQHGLLLSMLRHSHCWHVILRYWMESSKFRPGKLIGSTADLVGVQTSMILSRTPQAHPRAYLAARQIEFQVLFFYKLVPSNFIRLEALSRYNPTDLPFAIVVG